MTGKKTAAQLRAEADRAFNRAAEVGGSDGSAYRARASELLAEAAEVEKVEAATPKPTARPASRTVPGMMTKVDSSADIVKRAQLAATYAVDFAHIRSEAPAVRAQVDALERALKAKTAPVTTTPDVESRRRELLAKADALRAEDPVASQGYREMARMLGDGSAP